MRYANNNKQNQIRPSHASKAANVNAKPDYATMSEDEIYEYLEIKYGPYFALNVVEEMRKAKKAA